MKRLYMSGFALLQVAVLMVIISSLFALISPLLKATIKNNKHIEERVYLNEASRSLVGYAFIHGGLPSPGVNNTLPVAVLGLPAVGPYGKVFYYDVNPALAEAATTGDIASFCQAVSDEVKVSHRPLTWNARDYSDASNTAGVAFVVLAAGENQLVDGENTPIGAAGDGVYENPATGWLGSYDDSVAAYPLVQLCQRCDKLGVLCDGV